MLKAGVAVGLSVGLLLAVAVPALAAIDATLSTPAARPWDLVVLSTDDHSNAYAYGDLAANGPESVYLVSTSDFAKEIARYGFQRCPAPEQRYLGKLTWSGDSGTLSFRVPNVPRGDYYFELLVPYSSPQCWRIGASSGPLVLAVEAAKPVPARQAAAGQSHAGMDQWAAAVIGVVGGLVVAGGVLAGVALKRRGTPS